MNSTRVCERCGFETPYLYSHHVIPRSQGGIDGPTIKVCCNCHEDLHGGLMGGTTAWTPEAKAKRSAARSANWKDPEYRAKQRASRLQSWDDPQRRAATGQKAHEWHVSNPEAAAARVAKATATKRAFFNSDERERIETKRRAERAERLHPLGNLWTASNPQCVVCGKTDRPHVAKGECARCYARLQYHRRKEARHGSL